MCRRTIAPMASASARSPIAPNASAARPCTIGSGSSSAFSNAGRADASANRPSANAAICRTSNSSSASRRSQRLYTCGQPHATDSQRGAPPHTRFRVTKQANEIRWLWWSNDRRVRFSSPVAGSPERADWARAAVVDPRAGGSTQASLPRGRGEWWDLEEPVVRPRVQTRTRRSERRR